MTYARFQQLEANFTTQLAKKILLSTLIIPKIRDQVYTLAKAHGKLDTGIVDCSLVIYARKGDPRMVAKLIRRAVSVDGVNPHSDFQCTLAHAHAVKGDIAESLKILNAITDSSISEHKFGTLALLLGGHPDGLEWCLRVFNKLKDSSQGPQLLSYYNTLLKTVGKNGDFEKMEMLFEEMEKKGMEVDALTYGYMIEAYAKNSNMNKAVKLMEESERRGITLNVKSYHTILGGYATIGNSEEVARWKEMMTTDGCKPDNITTNMRVRSLIKQGKVVDALELVGALFEEMEKNGMEVDAVTFNNMIEAHVKNSNMDKAVALTEEAKRRGITLHISTYNAIFDRYVAMGNNLGAVIWKKKMQRFTKFTTKLQAQSLTKQGGINDAVKLVADAERKEERLDVVTFTSLLDEHIKSNNMDAALKLLDSLVHRGLRADAPMYNTIVSGYCNRGDMDQAKGVVDEMERNGVNPNSITFGTLINGYCKQGDMEQAQYVLDMMQKKNILPDAVAFNALIAGYCKQGKFDKALDIKEEIDKRKQPR